MPTYEYECSACGHRFEEFQSIKAKPTVVCPKCKKRKVKRLISAGGGFIFKGSGFYITDYRSDSYKESAKKDVAPSETPAAASPAAPAAGATPAPPAPTAPAAPAPAAPASTKSESKSSSKKK
jgi:putative FmdB family regulatory protein